MTWRVIVGTLSLVVTMVLLGYVAVTEQDRMANFSVAYDARQVEAGAALYETNCSLCHGLDGQGTGRAPALNAPDLFDGSRLAAINWAGTVSDYVEATIAGGRPRPSNEFTQYPERMPTWSQEFGGPLRTDQVLSLAQFVMNWGPAYANVTPEPTEAIVPVGTDITVALPAGDAAAGEQQATTSGCVACHMGASLVGPGWLASADPNGKGMGARAAERIAGADYTGQATSAEQYLFESIVQPSAFIPPGGSYSTADGASLMPATFGTSLSAQQVANLIAYLETLK